MDGELREQLNKLNKQWEVLKGHTIDLTMDVVGIILYVKLE